MKIVRCIYCAKSYPRAVMYNKNYCSEWCIEHEKTGFSFHELHTENFEKFKHNQNFNNKMDKLLK